MDISLNRRQFLHATAAALSSSALGGANVFAAQSERRSLAGEIGITTGGLNYQRENRILDAFSLPKFVQDELGMSLIDLNTRWLKSFDKSYVQRVRESAEKANCFFTNLKVNHQFGNLYSQTADERQAAMTNARNLVEAANTLGCRWVRFQVPKFDNSDSNSQLVAHRDLALFAELRGIELLVENGGWLKSDAESIRRVVATIGQNVAPCPDTGNWNDDIRYEALERSFPGAASCDFKVFDLDANYRHEKYDIRRCFEIGWQAGFRGPWAIEHWNEDLQSFARESVYLRDQLQKWMAAAE